ncbi:acyl-CoA N-acyltransferase [Xylaria digitata]|nr:acyl-CoA N-acyltransferase [Xylaria digitata]
MPLVVLPARICDIEAAYDIYFKAFEHEPVLRILFPQGVDRKVHTEVTKQLWNNNTNGYPIKCMDSDTGDIKPDGKDVWPNPRGAAWLDGKHRETADAILVPIWNTHEKLFGKRRHVYLPAIAVHPDHQRQGVGRLLMQWGVSVAENFGLPIYLESTGLGYPLYEAMRFNKLTHAQIIHKAEVTGGSEDTEIPLMVRMPSKAKGMMFEEWVDKEYPYSYE